MTKLAIVVLTVSVFIEAGLLCGLFTNEWIREKEYYLGIRRYCFNTKNDTSCHDVEDILPDIKEWMDAAYYILIGACVWFCLVLIILLSSLCCNGCDGSKTILSTSLIIFTWCILQSTVMTIFITKIVGSLSVSESSFGWSLYLELTTLITSWFLLIIQIVGGCCCKNGRCGNSFTNRVMNNTPIFQQPPSDISVGVGSDVNIQAIVINADSVSWYKNNCRVISFSTYHREEFDVASGLATLSITKTKFEHEGPYECIAEKYGNPTEQARHAFNLYILPVKPVFVRELVDTRVCFGDIIQLEAEVQQPESVISFQWLRNSCPLSYIKGKREWPMCNGKLTLNIYNATSEDSGWYTCCAISRGPRSNQEQTESHCQVQVYTAVIPSFPIKSRDKKVNEGEMFELRFKVDGYPRPAKVFWYKHDIIIQENRRVISQYLYLNGHGKLTVYDSCITDSGIYECIATNIYGTAKCRISVKVKSKQDNTAECPVCMERRPNKVLECGHALCEVCIDMISGTCPTCRAPFTEPSHLFLS